MVKQVIGIDNGVSGSIGILYKKNWIFERTPIRRIRYYTKKKSYITLIDTQELFLFLEPYSMNTVCYMERPMINPRRFKQSLSAILSCYMTVEVLEKLLIPHHFIDSKEWQKVLLPDIHGKDLKTESRKLAMKLFKGLRLNEDEDGDGILIAKYVKDNLL